jgi:hypothetical protein
MPEEMLSASRPVPSPWLSRPVQSRRVFEKGKENKKGQSKLGQERVERRIGHEKRHTVQVKEHGERIDSSQGHSEDQADI